MVSSLVNDQIVLNKTVTSTTTPGQSRPKSNDNERVLYILQHSRTGASPSDGLVSYPGHSFYPSAEMGCSGKFCCANFGDGIQWYVMQRITCSKRFYCMKQNNCRELCIIWQNPSTRSYSWCSKNRFRIC